MNICVCGWYGREFDDFYMTLYKAHKKCPVTVVAKKEDPYWEEMALPYVVMDNVGLEFGAYDYYLRNIWQGGSTLFTHDDVKLLPIIRDFKTAPMENIFEKFAEIPYDQAYIFTNRAEDVFGHGIHGRVIFMSDKLLNHIKPEGIWHDQHNQGITDHSQSKYNYNAGISKFDEMMVEAGKQGFTTKVKVYAPAYWSGYRGKLTDWEDLI
jgi:hypothetical protein